MAHAVGAGLFFLIVGAAQIAWGAAYLRNPSPRLHAVGLVVMAMAPTILYIITRLIRAPWSDGPEAIDALGIVTQVVQLGGAALLVRDTAVPLRVDSVAAVGMAIFVAIGGYGAGLAAENVELLSASQSLHHDDHGAAHLEAAHDDHEADHAGEGHEAHGGHGTTLVGIRGKSIVGNSSYYGPATGEAIALHCETIGQPNADCWVHFLTEYLVAYGSVPAFEQLNDLARTTPAADSMGHTLAHSLGHAAYQAYGLDIGLTLRECSYEVFQGCIHGALQAHFNDLAQQGLPLDRAALDSVCGYATTSFESYACVHGLGHGVMMYEAYDLHAALDRCYLMSDRGDRTNCYGGVFMENIVAYFASLEPDNAVHTHDGKEPTFWVDADDPAYPCNTVMDPYQPMCWRMQTSLILFFNQGDFRATARVCDEAGRHNLACYESLGRDAVPYSNRNPATMSLWCSSGDAEEQDSCVRAFTNGMILHFNTPKAGLDLCPQLPVKDKQSCYLATGRQASRMMGVADAEALCSTAEPGFVAACNEGRTG